MFRRNTREHRLVILLTGSLALHLLVAGAAALVATLPQAQNPEPMIVELKQEEARPEKLTLRQSDPLPKTSAPPAKPAPVRYRASKKAVGTAKPSLPRATSFKGMLREVSRSVEPAPSPAISTNGAITSSGTSELGEARADVDADAEEAVPLTSEKPKYRWYLSLIRDRINDAWKDPRRNGEGRGKVAIEFEIAKNGRLSLLSVQTREGALYLEEAAVHAVQNAAPFPRIPDHIRRAKSLRLIMIFHYQLDHIAR